MIAKSNRASTCVIGGGTYRETVHVSSLSKHAQAFVAAPGQVPVVSGLEALRGLHWTKTAKKCTFATELPAGAPASFEQLFYRGNMMVEARWPNLAVDRLTHSVLDRKTWQPMSKGTTYGHVVHPDLSNFNFSWNGALATLNVGHQFYTWTRHVEGHRVGSPSFNYSMDLPGLAMWKSGLNTPKWRDWGKNQFFLSGKLEALDAPGEWFLETFGTKNATTPRRRLYFRPNDRCAPPRPFSVEVKTRHYAFISTHERCLQWSGHIARDISSTVVLRGLLLKGATFKLPCCNRCAVENVTLSFPTYVREIVEMQAANKSGYQWDSGKHSPGTLLAGANSTIQDTVLRMSNAGGLAVRGDNNTVRNVLIDRTDWLGTLTFCPLSVQGNQNSVLNTTVRYFGNAGVVTGIPNTAPGPPQLPPMAMRGRRLTVAYSHIHHGGLIGSDSALLYAGSGWGTAGLHWHHNWIHHATEKCLRGDDQSRNMSVHHNVVFDCGVSLWNHNSYRAGLGLVLKGNGHDIYSNTVFRCNTSDMCLPTCVEKLKSFRKQYPRKEQNNATLVLNTVSAVLSGQCGCSNNTCGGDKRAIFRGADSMLGLVAPDKFDFRPTAASPLVDAGVERAPYTVRFA